MGDWELRAENIYKSFGGVKALDDVSLHIKQGEIVCLVGENGSGKSTMIKIISGVYSADKGELIIDDHRYQDISPIESIREGIQVIYQDFSLFPNLSVAENLAINDQISSGKKLVNWKDYRKIAAEGLAEIHVSIDLDQFAGELSAADRQLIAIAKAIMAKARIIIMDEPTTALTQKEIQSLFATIRHLKERGIAILFVSHKLTEVMEIAERTMIFRNGKKVLDRDSQGLDIKTMEFYMTGRELDSSRSTSGSDFKDKGNILEVENLNLEGEFSDISFHLKRGEILGITGLLGSGRGALALSLFGVTPPDAGKIKIAGKEVKIKKIQNAIQHKIGYVPEDRIREGLFLSQPIEDNIVASTIDKLVDRLSLIREQEKSDLAADWIRQLNIKTPTGALPAMSLSGGNQQRVVLAKWLANNPDILILNGPTVGVDVGSKAEIHQLIQSLAEQGMGILLISDDIPELIYNCDRIILMREGKISSEFERGKINAEELNEAMIGKSLEIKN
jgi:simple sugar transport system ATP-binding protein